ncbi:MAG: FG-GAP-like repeat-containing protein [Candidatus Eisenbacteria bacterium]
MQSSFRCRASMLVAAALVIAVPRPAWSLVGSGTLEMAKRLAEINATVDPALCYHMNEARAEAIAALIPTAPDAQKGPLRFQYANELLNAGRTEDAIAELESLLADIGEAGTGPIPDPVRAIYEILAVAYMRLGEQENCVLNHSSDSCLFPIQGSGVHQLPRGSRGAIAIYERLLATHPDDLQSRYLLNLAHMTLGQYPDSVPEAYRIPVDALSGDEGAAFPRFVDMATPSGVDVRGLSGGCCIEDFDGDGLLDIFATAYGVGEQAHLFHSRGNGSFEDRTEAAGLVGIIGGLNTLHADYDNDGDPDILILRGGWLGKGGERPCSLLRNDGTGKFEDVTFAAGILSERPTQTASWADFDGDGWLDLFIGNESRRDRTGAIAQDYPCELYRNNGDGTFTDVAPELGLDLRQFVKGVVWGDVDGDGWSDLFVSVLGGANLLYRNLAAGEVSVEGAGDAASGAEASSTSAGAGEASAAFGRRFEEVGKAAGVTEPFFSFPTWFFDYDNDGDLDLYVSGYDLRRLGKVGEDYGAELLGLESPGERPRLYRNRGDGTFEDVSAASGLTDVVYSMGSNFGDIDTDGFLDIYVGTGAPDFRSIVPNKMYRNEAGETFADVTLPGGFGHVQKGHGIAFADVDNDGDQDIYAVMGGAYQGDVFQNALFQNPGFGHSWVTLVLEGTKVNRSAIGASVTVHARDAEGAEHVFHRIVCTGGSFGSSSLQLEVGLGDATEVESVVVVWPYPSHATEVFEGLETGKRFRLREGSGAAMEMACEPFQLGASGGGEHDHHHHH